MPPTVAPVALLCSVPMEAAPVRVALTGAAQLSIGRRSVWSGRLGGREVLLMVCGMGKTNAAQSLTALLEQRHCSLAIGFGVAGAYAGSGLDLGDVVLADSAVYADEGVESPDGWLSPRDIGIPLLEVAGGVFYDSFPLGGKHLDAARAAAAAAGISVATGPVATVSTCSGTAARGGVMGARHGALCEAMEGAAWAHVARLYGTPYLELRGISNLVEDRDPARWNLAAGAEAAAAALLAVVDRWDPLD